MTEPTPVARAAKTGRGVKIVLAMSLALNLAVAGVVGGAALRSYGDGDGRRQVARDLNFGPFTDALTRPQLREMLAHLGDGRGGLRDMRAQIRGDMDAVLAALQAEPFDPAEVEAVLTRQSERLTARADSGRKALVAVILAMSPEDRAAFTARLAEVVTRRPATDRARHDRAKP